MWTLEAFGSPKRFLGTLLGLTGVWLSSCRRALLTTVVRPVAGDGRARAPAMLTLASGAAWCAQPAQCLCADWCGWAPGFESNCGQGLHCCACDECVAMGVEPPKWWDQNNFYADRSCLVWGVEEVQDYGDVLHRTFCEVQRPICHGHDCNDPHNGHVDDNTFWCAVARRFSAPPDTIYRML